MDVWGQVRPDLNLERERSGCTMIVAGRWCSDRSIEVCLSHDNGESAHWLDAAEATALRDHLTAMLEDQRP